MSYSSLNGKDFSYAINTLSDVSSTAVIADVNTERLHVCIVAETVAGASPKSCVNVTSSLKMSQGVLS